MKKNVLQIISVCLSAVLLVVCLYQGKLLREYKEQLDWEIESLRDDFTSEIENVSYRMEAALEKAQRIVENYSIETYAISADSWARYVSASVTLKEYYDDTEVTLLVGMDEEKLSLPMTRSDSGVFSANIEFPLDYAGHTQLHVQIRSNGKIVTEDISTWLDYKDQLPLQSYGGGNDGWSYENGVLSSQFYINLTSQDGQMPTVANGEFLVYKNGELVQTLEATVHGTLSYDNVVAFAVNAPDYRWRLECALNDVIEIRFHCLDTYGIGYNFHVASLHGSYLYGPYDTLLLFRPE